MIEERREGQGGAGDGEQARNPLRAVVRRIAALLLFPLAVGVGLLMVFLGFLLRPSRWVRLFRWETWRALSPTDQERKVLLKVGGAAMMLAAVLVGLWLLRIALG